MSLNEQINVHISVVNDLCHSEQNDSQNREKCAVDNVITKNVLLDNETILNSNATNDGNERSLKESENYERLAIEENVNVPTLEAITRETEIVQAQDIIIFTDNGHVVTDKRDNVVDNSENGHDNAPVAPINEVLATDLIPVNEGQLLTIDSPIGCETAPRSVNVDLSNNPRPENLNETNLTRCAEEKDVESCVQQENNESNDGLPDVESHTNDQPEGFTNASHVDNNESEQIDDVDDDASNDGNDNFSNERDSNDECSDVEHSDGTTEVENDEYILDTVLRKPRKERRRIVSVNDDSDLEIDVERERLLQSPTVEENQLTDIEGEEDIVHLIQNEKPGPKSKKFSTQKLKEIQARELLRNAVVIPSSSKKKKRRVIDSEDDEELLPYCVDVDDIGLPDTIGDNENDGNDSDALVGSSILLNDATDFDKADVPSIENLIQNCSPDVNTVDENTIKSEPEGDSTPVVPQCSSDIKCSSESSEGIQNQSSEVVPPLKEECLDSTENETGVLCDSGNSTDSTNQQNRREMESNYANTDFPPFSSSSSSESEDEFIPNEIYFGTPDHKGKRSLRGKAQRGRPAQPSTRGVKTVLNVSRSTNKGRGGGRPSRRDNFIDNRRISSTSCSVSGTSSSDSDDEYRNTKARRKPATITIVKQPSQLYHKASLPVRPIQRQHQPQPTQRQNDRKRDRFYDKSRDIPNSVYFGDVDVPLHVLHAYGNSDSDNDKRDTKAGAGKSDTLNRFLSQSSRGRPMPLAKRSRQLHSDTRKQPPNSRKVHGRPKAKADSSLSPSNDQSIQMMKTYLKAAGLKKVKLNRLWEGCKSNPERADKMLELLREKGLEGEPTVAKCRQLKVDFLTKKEIEDLDPNLIIQTEGRTTRRSTRAATRRQYTYDEEEILETRTKLRKVIDSDSDFE